MTILTERFKEDIRHIREHAVMQMILVFMFILSASAIVGLGLQMSRTNDSNTLSICIIFPAGVIMTGSSCILCFPLGEKKKEVSPPAVPEEVRIDIPTTENPMLTGSPKKVKSQLEAQIEALAIRAPRDPSSYTVRRLEYDYTPEIKEENPMWKSETDEKSPKKKKGRSSPK